MLLVAINASAWGFLTIDSTLHVKKTLIICVKIDGKEVIGHAIPVIAEKVGLVASNQHHCCTSHHFIKTSVHGKQTFSQNILEWLSIIVFLLLCPVVPLREFLGIPVQGFPSLPVTLICDLWWHVCMPLILLLFRPYMHWILCLFRHPP